MLMVTFIFNVIIISLSLIGILSMFLVKHKFAEKIIPFLMIIFCLAIGFLNMISQPSNYILQKAIIIILAIIPLIALTLLAYKKINWLVFKIIVTIGIIASNIYIII